MEVKVNIIVSICIIVTILALLCLAGAILWLFKNIVDMLIKNVGPVLKKKKYNNYFSEFELMYKKIKNGNQEDIINGYNQFDVIWKSPIKKLKYLRNWYIITTVLSSCIGYILVKSFIRFVVMITTALILFAYYLIFEKEYIFEEMIVEYLNEFSNKEFFYIIIGNLFLFVIELLLIIIVKNLRSIYNDKLKNVLIKEYYKLLNKDIEINDRSNNDDSIEEEYKNANFNIEHIYYFICHNKIEYDNTEIAHIYVSKSRQNTQFNGIFVKSLLKNDIDSYIKISLKETNNNINNKLNLITIENNEFAEIYNVFSDNRNLALELLKLIKD